MGDTYAIPPDPLRIHCSFNVGFGAFELWMISQQSAAVEVIFRDKPQYGAVVEPFLRLSTEQGQSLMDALWKAGLRPNEPVAVDSVIAAKDEHLKDLREILKKVKIR